MERATSHSLSRLGVRDVEVGLPCLLGDVGLREKLKKVRLLGWPRKHVPDIV